MFKLGEKEILTYEPESYNQTAVRVRKMIRMMGVLFVFSFSLTLLFLGMRGVMDLGGMVASGGPYAVAHPAPDWIWLVPVSVLMMVASILAGVFMSASDFKGPNLMLFAWSALFGVLGWNFLEYGLGLGKETGLEWSWLICALLFFAMSLVPLVLITRHKMAAFRNARGSLTGLWYLFAAASAFRLCYGCLGGQGCVYMGG